MGEYYQKELRREYLRSESPLSQDYEREFTREEKDNLFKEIYSNMKLFENMLHEVRQAIKSGNNSRKINL